MQTPRGSMRSARFFFVVATLLGITLARCPVRADSEAYRECDVFNGQRTWCGSWYQGKAVAYHDGAYRECSIFNGQISSCGSWYQGKTVAYRDGAYRECDVFNGNLTWCGSWYQGKAVLRAP